MTTESLSLRAAAILGLNALHECIVPKGAETQISDAMRALRAAIDAKPLFFAARAQIDDIEHAPGYLSVRTQQEGDFVVPVYD